MRRCERSEWQARKAPEQHGGLRQEGGSGERCGQSPCSQFGPGAPGAARNLHGPFATAGKVRPEKVDRSGRSDHDPNHPGCVRRGI